MHGLKKWAYLGIAVRKILDFTLPIHPSPYYQFVKLKEPMSFSKHSLSGLALAQTHNPVQWTVILGLVSQVFTHTHTHTHTHRVAVTLSLTSSIAMAFWILDLQRSVAMNIQPLTIPLNHKWYLVVCSPFTTLEKKIKMSGRLCWEIYMCHWITHEMDRERGYPCTQQLTVACLHIYDIVSCNTYIQWKHSFLLKNGHKRIHIIASDLDPPPTL